MCLNCRDRSANDGARLKFLSIKPSTRNLATRQRDVKLSPRKSGKKGLTPLPKPLVIPAKAGTHQPVIPAITTRHSRAGGNPRTHRNLAASTTTWLHISAPRPERSAAVGHHAQQPAETLKGSNRARRYGPPPMPQRVDGIRYEFLASLESSHRPRGRPRKHPAPELDPNQRNGTLRNWNYPRFAFTPTTTSLISDSGAIDVHMTSPCIAEYRGLSAYSQGDLPISARPSLSRSCR